MKKNKLVALRFMQAFDDLSNDPKKSEFYDIKKFVTPKLNNTFRLRIGRYRAIYRIKDNQITIYVFSIGARGDIYKHTNL